MDEKVTFKQWIKANYKFAIILLVLAVLAIFSLAYAYANEYSPISANDDQPKLADAGLRKLPLAETLPAENGSGNTSTGDATLGANTKCLDNEKALTAVNLKITQEKQHHENVIKEIGHGGLMKRLQSELRGKVHQENRRHNGAMELLRQEYEDLLSQLDC